jgi:ribulose-phosphate 3-epimerase
MVDICPTITAADVRTYQVQIDQVAGFATRLHIDLSDGEFTPNKLLGLEYVWWPGGIQADIHIMYRRPFEQMELLLGLHPQLVIVHAESEGDFIGTSEILHQHGIEVGVALLPETTVETITPSLEHIDHVLIFSGNIGYFGGNADLKLLEKVKKLKILKPQLEIGWDGGVNDKNAAAIVAAGVEVLDAGGYIHGASNPEEAYRKLKLITESAA